MKYCIHCGKENDDNAKFCKYCGANSEMNIQNRGSNVVKKKNKRIYTWIIVVLTILIIGFFVYLNKFGGATSFVKDNLVSEEWQVYYAYNSYDEEMIAPQLFGNGVSYMNRLSFYEDGRFELVLSSYTNDCPDGMMTGKYECNGTNITLYSDISDEVIELNYETLEHKNYVGVDGLCWTTHMMDLYGNEDDYKIYFSSPAFFK